MYRRLERLTLRYREPAPVAVRLARAPVLSDARVSLASGDDIAMAVTRLTALACGADARHALIVPSTSAGPRAVRAVSACLSRTSAVSVGVAAAMPSPHRARWEAFAAQSGLGLVRLGERGWDRVELGERSAILQYVDVPAELAGAGDVVFVQSGQRSPLETWKLIVHPNSAMRALASGDAGLVELALAVDARYITLRSVGTVVLGVDCRDRVASELLSAAVSRLDADAGGVETLGPWEESRVQILAALAGGITLPTQLVIRAFASDTGIAQWIPRLGELIGCRVEWHDEGAHADER